MLVVRGAFSPARAWRPAVVARLARTLGHAGETFPYPKCSFLVPRRLDTSLGCFREVRGSCHLCGGRPFWLSPRRFIVGYLQRVKAGCFTVRCALRATATFIAFATNRAGVA